MGPAGERQQQQHHQQTVERGQKGKAGGSGKGAAVAGEVGGATNAGSKMDVDGGHEGAATTWATVVRGPRGKRSAVPEQQVDGGGDSGEGDDETREDEGGTGSEDDLPPMRVFVQPSESREAILRRVEAAEAKARRAKERGAKEEKVRRAEEEAGELSKRLREAGGGIPHCPSLPDQG